MNGHRLLPRRLGENRQAFQEMNMYQLNKWARYNDGKDQQIAPVVWLLREV